MISEKTGKTINKNCSKILWERVKTLMAGNSCDCLKYETIVNGGLRIFALETGNIPPEKPDHTELNTKQISSSHHKKPSVTQAH